MQTAPKGLCGHPGREGAGSRVRHCNTLGLSGPVTRGLHQEGTSAATARQQEPTHPLVPCSGKAARCSRCVQDGVAAWGPPSSAVPGVHTGAGAHKAPGSCRAWGHPGHRAARVRGSESNQSTSLRLPTQLPRLALCPVFIFVHILVLFYSRTPPRPLLTYNPLGKWLLAARRAWGRARWAPRGGHAGGGRRAGKKTKRKRPAHPAQGRIRQIGKGKGQLKCLENSGERQGNGKPPPRGTPQGSRPTDPTGNSTGLTAPAGSAKAFGNSAAARTATRTESGHRLIPAGWLSARNYERHFELVPAAGGSRAAPPPACGTPVPCCPHTHSHPCALSTGFPQVPHGQTGRLRAPMCSRGPAQPQPAGSANSIGPP